MNKIWMKCSVCDYHVQINENDVLDYGECPICKEVMILKLTNSNTGMTDWEEGIPEYLESDEISIEGIKDLISCAIECDGQEETLEYISAIADVKTRIRWRKLYFDIMEIKKINLDDIENLKIDLEIYGKYNIMEIE